jgi:hypothetical protein
MINLSLAAPQASTDAPPTLYDAVVEVLQQCYANVTHSVFKCTHDGYVTEKDREHIRWQLRVELLAAAERFSDDVAVSVVINWPNIAKGESLRVDCKVVNDGSLIWPSLTVW